MEAIYLFAVSVEKGYYKEFVTIQWLTEDQAQSK